LDNSIENTLGDEKYGEHRGSRIRILIPNELDLSFHAPNDYAKFHQNRPIIATVGVTIDRQTDRQTDASDFIICPMLCYSNGTDNYSYNVISFSTGKHLVVIIAIMKTEQCCVSCPPGKQKVGVQKIFFASVPHLQNHRATAVYQLSVCVMSL